jgi:hypothetical protein
VGVTIEQVGIVDERALRQRGEECDYVHHGTLVGAEVTSA